MIKNKVRFVKNKKGEVEMIVTCRLDSKKFKPTYYSNKPDKPIEMSVLTLRKAMRRIRKLEKEGK